MHINRAAISIAIIIIAFLGIYIYIIPDPLPLSKEVAMVKNRAIRERPAATRAVTTLKPFLEAREKQDPQQNAKAAQTANLINALDELSRIASITDPSIQKAEYEKLSDIWSLQDPVGFFAWVMTQKDTLLKSACLIHGVAALCNAGRIEDSLVLIEKVPRGEYRDFAITAGFTGISARYPDKALDLLLSLSGNGAINYCAKKFGDVLGTVSDMKQIDSFLEKIPYGSVRSMVQNAMISKMAETSPRVAFLWFNDHQVTNPYVSEVLRNIANGFISNNIIEGINIAEEMQNSNRRLQYLNILATTWGRKSPDECSTWLINAVNNEGYAKNKQMFDSAIPEVVQLDHDGIFQTINNIKNPKDRELALIVAATALSKYDPASAAERMLPVLNLDSQENVQAITHLTYNWLARDPLAATKWVNGLRNGPLQDASIELVVSNILENDRDLEMASQWAAKITAEHSRKRALAKIYNSSNSK